MAATMAFARATLHDAGPLRHGLGEFRRSSMHGALSQNVRPPAALVIAELSVICLCTAENSRTPLDAAGPRSPESNSPRGRVSQLTGRFRR
jgi:hypothetical protein